MKHQQRYCVTALNALTQMRDIVSPPCSYCTAKQVIYKFNRESSDDSPYSDPKICIYNPIKH